MFSKSIARIKRGKKTRYNIKRLNGVRLCIHRSSKHIYAQVIAANGSEVIASASTLDKEVSAVIAEADKTAAAKIVGEIVAKRALEKGVSTVSFDRSGFKYHGRVKALADAARAKGLQF
ncbi:MAG: 50S ribosomal protein L18 [Legionellaceae bacterium]